MSNYVQWRAGVAELAVEVGRWSGVAREERKCEFCQSGEVEDEVHCLSRCKAWEVARRKLVWRKGKSEEEFVQWLLGGTDYRGSRDIKETARIVKGIGEWMRMRKEEQKRRQEEEKIRKRTEARGKKFKWKVRPKRV